MPKEAFLSFQKIVKKLKFIYNITPTFLYFDLYLNTAYAAA